MKKIISLILTVTLLFLACASAFGTVLAAIDTATYYVSADGDQNTADGSLEKPFINIADALTYANTQGFDSEDTVTVKLLGAEIAYAEIPAYSYDLVITSGNQDGSQTKLNLTDNSYIARGGDTVFDNIYINYVGQWKACYLGSSNVIVNSNVTFKNNGTSLTYLDNSGTYSLPGQSLVWNTTYPQDIRLSGYIGGINATYTDDVSLTLNGIGKAHIKFNAHFNQDYRKTKFEKNVNINIKKATAIEFTAHQNVTLNGALQVINSSGAVLPTTSGSLNDIAAGSKWFLDVKTDNPDAIQFTDTVGKYKVNVDPEEYTVKAYLKGTDEAIAVAQNGYLDLTSFEGGAFTIIVGGEFYMRDFKKGYVTFIFDDARMPFTEEAAKIFKEFGYPMSCAVPGKNVTEGSDLHKLLLDIQARGGEILSHGMNHRAVTAEGKGGIYKYDDVYNEFSQSYEKLTNLGFEVNGIIEVGNGGNESTADYEMIEPISRKFFKYSNSYGVSPQYKQPRRFMSWDSLQSIKNQINKAKDNKTWHILSAHDQNEVTNDSKDQKDGYQYLREILQYIKDTNGAVEVVTWDYMYNTYAEYSGDPVHKGGTATCSERAVCDICNFKYGTISPENHSDINFVQAKGEVHTQTELKGAVAAHHVCEGCEKVFKDNNGVVGEETTIAELTSEAPEHNKANIKDAKPGNCGVNGYTGDKYCSVCDKKMENGANIPATGKHTGGTATCKTKAKCTVCQLQYGTINANNHQNKVNKAAVAATCSKTGFTAGVWCNDCQKYVSGHTVIAKIAHKSDNGVVTKATTSKNGKITYTCSKCSAKIKSSKTIYKVTKFKLSTDEYTYNGKAKKPSVTVKDYKGNTLKKDTDYTIKYASGRKNPGKYSVKITLKGKYSGSKTLYFVIEPKKTKLSKLTSSAKKTMKVYWNKDSKASGYQIEYALNSKFTKSDKTVTIKGYKTDDKTIKDLKSKKTYFVRVRAYKTVDGKKIYGAWSSYKKIKVK